MEAHEFIAGHELVIERNGSWPSFHDGEVHRMVLDRARPAPDGERRTSVELVVDTPVWSEDLAPGQFLPRLLVHFLFEDIVELELEDWNHQNVLWSLEFALGTDAESGARVLSVELNHCYGLSGKLAAHRASIVSVERTVAPRSG